MNPLWLLVPVLTIYNMNLRLPTVLTQSRTYADMLLRMHGQYFLKIR